MERRGRKVLGIGRGEKGIRKGVGTDGKGDEGRSGRRGGERGKGLDLDICSGAPELLVTPLPAFRSIDLYDRTLPERSSNLVDCNFIIRMLYILIK